MTDTPKLEPRTDPPSEDDLKSQLAEMGVGDLQEGRVVETQRADTLPVAETAEVNPETAPEPVTPDKFKDSSKEDVVKAYLELESQSSKDKQGVERLNPTEPEVPKGLESLDYNKYADEWNENQELGADSRKELTDQGIPEAIIDQYVRGLAATRDQQVDQIMGFAGGEQNYQQMHTWMQANIPETEKTAFLETVTAGADMRVIEMAMKGMLARYQASPQGNHQQITGRPESGSILEPYRTRTESDAAQRDPRYATDPTYRDDVNQRIMRMNPKLFNTATGS